MKGIEHISYIEYLYKQEFSCGAIAKKVSDRMQNETISTSQIQRLLKARGHEMRPCAIEKHKMKKADDSFVSDDVDWTMQTR